MYFGGYYGSLSRQNVEKSCEWAIENWIDEKANSVQGIIGMVLSSELKDSPLVVTVSVMLHIKLNSCKNLDVTSVVLDK